MGNLENADQTHRIAWCCLAIIVALLVVGSVSHGVLRHIVQTAPLWAAVVLGFRRSELTKWVALPSFLFWLMIMIFIWLFLLGWAQIVQGTFSPTEIAMTLIVGIASIAGLISCFRTRATTSWEMAVLSFLIFAGLQLLTFRLSLLPAIAHR
jgi:hypothetical protein